MTSIAIDRVDGLSSAAAIKGPCRAATTANISLYGEQTIDAVAVVTGNRVLVKNQTTPSENGIWICDTGQWRRSKDFSRTNDVVKGTQVAVTDGTANGGYLYSLMTDNPINVGVTSIIFDIAGIVGAAEAAADRAEAEADRAEAYADLALNTWGHIAGVGDNIITDIPLAADPGSTANTIVNFDGILQMKSTYSLVDIIGVTNIRFSSPIPSGIPYEIEYGNRTAVPTPADGSITTIKIASNAVTFDKMQDIPTSTFLGRLTAGTGDPEALTVAQAQSLFTPTGSVIDSKTVRYTTNANLTAVIPLDDTIPQITEGTEIISTTFTMKSVTNILRLRFRGSGSNSIASPLIVGIFIAGDANAKTAAFATVPGVNYEVLVDCGIDLVPAVLTALTISVRAGPGAATTTRFNGDPSGRFLGGSMGAILLIEEIKA